jgi:hypothetical protein
MPICGKQTEKHVPNLLVECTAFTEKTTRSLHLHICFAADDLNTSALATNTIAAGTAGTAVTTACVVSVVSEIVDSVASSAGNSL